MISWKMKLSKAHFKTLERVFVEPPPSDIPWPDVQRLFEAVRKVLGGVVNPAFGGRVRVKLDDGDRYDFHPPDPEGLTNEGNIREARRLLISVGVKPWLR